MKFPKRASKSRRKHSHDSELLDAVKKARQDPALAQDKFVSVVEIAQVCPKYWGVHWRGFERYLNQRIDPAERERLKILAPRQNQASYA